MKLRVPLNVRNFISNGVIIVFLIKNLLSEVTEVPVIWQSISCLEISTW
jgi:hypothetical protein